MSSPGCECCGNMLVGHALERYYRPLGEALCDECLDVIRQDIAYDKWSERDWYEEL